jgi:tetratricopeptide (TPR) repeat protein
VAAGLSLAQVGGVELTRQAVHLIETGKVRPSMRSLRVLADRLEVPVASLLAPSETRGPFDQDSVAEMERLLRNHQHDQVLARGSEILEWSRSPELIACAHYQMGDALLRMDRPDEAMEHLEQARELFETLDDEGRLAETRDLEALALQIREDPRALGVASQALSRYRERDERRPEVESRLLQRIGTILSLHRKFGEALRYYDEALHVSGGVRDLMRLARLYHGLALCHQGDGDIRLGTDLLLKAHTLYEAEERLADAPTGSDLARVENDIAVLLIRHGDLERGDEFLASSIRRYEAIGVHRRRSHTLLSLAELRQGQRRFDEAAAILREAIDLAGELHETQALGAGHRQLGELFAARGRMDRAAESFQRALEILRSAGLEQPYADCVAARDRALGLTGASEASGTIA